MAGMSTMQKRPETRVLVRWNPDLDVRLLLAVDSVCKAKKISLPWEDIARVLGPKFSSGAIIQHMAKLRSKAVEADREARKEGHEPVAEVRSAGRSRRTAVDQEPQTPDGGSARKREASGSVAAGDSESSSDEDWGKKKKRSKKSKSSAKNKAKIGGKERASSEYTTPSMNTRRMVTDYSKLLGNDKEDEEDECEVKSDGSKGEGNISTCDNTPSGIKASGEGQGKVFSEISPIATTTPATAETRASKIDMPSNFGIMAPPPPPHYPLGTTSGQAQFNDPFALTMPMNTALMANAHYPLFNTGFSGFGGSGYHPYQQSPPMFANNIDPRQSVSSNSTQALMNNAQYGGFGTTTMYTAGGIGNVAPENLTHRNVAPEKLVHGNLTHETLAPETPALKTSALGEIHGIGGIGDNELDDAGDIGKSFEQAFGEFLFDDEVDMGFFGNDAT